VVNRVVAVILAAGKGSRLGGPKALLVWPSPAPTRGEGRPLAIAHAEERLAAESGQALIVTRRQWLPALLRYVRPGIDLLASDAEEELGPAGSIACAVPRLGDAFAIVITPVDAVPARRETVAPLLARLDADPSLLAVRPSYHGLSGHPVVLRPSALARYRDPAPPPLRDHLKALGERCASCEVADATVLIDLNKPADVMGVLGAMPRFVSS
jgi:molybdenum cofactor cytidylyltransferase